MDYKNINDYEQIYLIKEKDDEAKELMFQKYKPIVLSIANKYYQNFVIKGIDIEDLIQEGNIGLSNAIENFKETEDVCFYTFCIICIERQIKAYCKKYTSTRSEIINNSYSIDMLSEQHYRLQILLKEEKCSYNPENYVLNLYDCHQLIHFKNTLSFPQSLIFELRFNGFKYREIANLLEVSVNTVDSTLHKLKEKLLDYLNK